MKIALIGYGKMGKTIHQIAEQNNVEIAAIIDTQNLGDIKTLHLKNIQIAIEFSTPETVVQNVSHLLHQKIPTIIGTTGWYNQLDTIEKLAQTQQTSILTATNFSLGVNIFFALNSKLAQLMQGKNYETSITEIHHTQKIDKPSGTAISIAQQIFENNSKYNTWKLDDNEWNNALKITALREENVPGTHIVQYKNTIDEIEIKHTAHNRDGFATGALTAAKWLVYKPFGIYTMQHVLGF